MIASPVQEIAEQSPDTKLFLHAFNSGCCAQKSLASGSAFPSTPAVLVEVEEETDVVLVPSAAVVVVVVVVVLDPSELVFVVELVEVDDPSVLVVVVVGVVVEVELVDLVPVPIQIGVPALSIPPLVVPVGH